MMIQDDFTQTDFSGFTKVRDHAIQLLISNGFIQNNECWTLPGKKEEILILNDPRGLFFLTGAPRAAKNTLTASQIIAKLEHKDFDLCLEELARRYLT